MWIAGDFTFAVLLHGGQEQAETRALRQTEAGKSGLSVPRNVAAATDSVVLVSDQEAVIRVAQKAQTANGGGCCSAIMEEETEGLFRSTSDAPAKLVKLCQTEALGLFDDHDRSRRDVHADFDDGGGDEKARFAQTERVQRVLTDGNILLAVGEADEPFEALFQRGPAFFCRCCGLCLAVFDERADPENLHAIAQGAADAGEHAVERVHTVQGRADRLSPRRFRVQTADAHFTPFHELERAGNGGRRHDENVCRFALGAQIHTLADAESVLLVDNGKAEVVESHAVLKQGMGSDDDFCSPIRDGSEGFAPGCALDGAAQIDAFGRAETGKRFKMLAGKDLGGGHEGSLRAGLDGLEHGVHGDEGLARADIALKQAHHGR